MNRSRRTFHSKLKVKEVREKRRILRTVSEPTLVVMYDGSSTVSERLFNR